MNAADKDAYFVLNQVANVPTKWTCLIGGDDLNLIFDSVSVVERRKTLWTVIARNCPTRFERVSKLMRRTSKAMEDY